MVEDRERASTHPAVAFLARKRVALGFAAALVTAIAARPTWPAWRVGLFIAVAGELVRIWAAGHLEKGREVTRSGPYRWVRHPLYVGSLLIALGVIVASRSAVVAAIVTVYMVATIAAAIRTEEAFLRRSFGAAYDLYRDSRAEPMRRRFSAARALRNREYRAVIGVAVGFALLAMKVLLSI
jgi:protein-S-isoprenylcysteine O-methyltransferase Ste14